MRSPTNEQQAVLDSTARIRIVRSAPGSGKTWLVAEVVRRELDAIRHQGGAIAALSFTRVGGNEIQRALSYNLDHPHFVGTIDAFLFRYVVRPFLQRAHSDHSPPRLIPADWNPTKWTKQPGGSAWETRIDSRNYNILEACFVGEDATGPVLAHPQEHQRPIERVSSNVRNSIMRDKRRIWKTLGWVTHSDAAFLASELLSHPTYGPAIRSSLIRRFSMLIVDELQDTSFFQCKCIQTLLSEPSSRGVLVGDPCQAIYEFNGARPDLFRDFERTQGAVVLSLTRSRRCPSAVAACAIQLMDPPGPFLPDGDRVGRAFLVQYTEMTADVERLVRAIRAANPTANAKVVVRRNKTAYELKSGKAEEIGKLRCPALTHLAEAVQSFRCGHQTKALYGARAAIDLAVLRREGITDEHLEGTGINAQSWKALAVKCLLNADTLDSSQTMENWQTSAGVMLDNAIRAFGLPPVLSESFVPGRLKPFHLTGKQRIKAKADKIFSAFAPRRAALAVTSDLMPVETVHAVKGETHDITIFVCPDLSNSDRCPSEAWWSTNAVQLEERRIAFVAMTRTRADLVLYVSNAAYSRLCRKQPTFAGAFEHKTVDECIVAFTPPPPPPPTAQSTPPSPLPSPTQPHHPALPSIHTPA